jgi:serine/threonine-protein kinase
LPAGFDAWFARATSLNPSDRFRTASEQVSALAEILGLQLPPASVTRAGDSNESIPDRPDSGTQRTVELKTPSTAVDWTNGSPPSPSHKKWTAVVITAAASVVGAASVQFVRRSRATPPAAAEKVELGRERPSGQSAATSVPEPSPSTTANALEASSAAATSAPPRATSSAAELNPRPRKPAAQPRAPKPAARPTPTSLYTRD